MATNREMLKEAIADAKAVKETAIANAKAALEEAFTPQLKSMLSMKLQEMEKEEMDEIEDKMYEMKDKDAMEEGYDEDMMEIDLEELLAELNEEEDMDEAINEAEEEEEEESEESEEGEEEGEPIELEDMTDEDLKSMIEDVIKDMIEAGELEAGETGEEEAEGEDEIEIEDEEEVDLAELLREIEEMEDPMYEMEEPVDEIFGLGKKSAEKGAGGSSFVKDWISKHQSEIDSVKDIEDLAARKKAASPMIIQFSKDAIRAQQDQGSKTFDIGVLWNAFDLNDPRGGKTRSPLFEEELAEAYSTIETLRSELNEINLLNAKLLYTNKIFKAKNLNESQKVKVLSSFDKAKNVGEVKMVFETLNEGIKVSKNPIKEHLGRASKTTNTPIVKKPIVESNEAFLRMQKLAGII